MIKDYNKTLIIKDITTGDIINIFDYNAFSDDFETLTFSELNFGHLFLLEDVLSILNQGHEVYIYVGYKK